MHATKLNPAKKSPDRRDARHRAQVEGGNKPIAPGSRDWIGRASRGTRNRSRIGIGKQIRAQLMTRDASGLFDLEDFFGRNAAPRPAVKGDSINPERFGGCFLCATFPAQIAEEG